MKIKSKFNNSLTRTKLLGTMMAACLMLMLVSCQNEEVITDEHTAEVGDVLEEDYAEKESWSYYKPIKGTYKFRNLRSKHYLSCETSRNGANVTQDNSHNLFYVRPIDGDDSGYYYICETQTDDRRVVDVAGFQTGNGANIHLWDNKNGGNQHWVFEKYRYQIDGFDVVRMRNLSVKSGASAKYLSVQGASYSRGANIITYELNDKRDQFWYLEPHQLIYD